MNKFINKLLISCVLILLLTGCTNTNYYENEMNLPTTDAELYAESEVKDAPGENDIAIQRLKKLHLFYKSNFDRSCSFEYYYDVTHDGYDELIVGGYAGAVYDQYRSYSLRVYDIVNESVQLVFYDYGEEATFGERMELNINLYEEGGLYYLVRTIRGVWTGLGTYGYDIFYINSAKVSKDTYPLGKDEYMKKDMEEYAPQNGEEYIDKHTYSTNNDLSGTALDEEIAKAEGIWAQADQDYAAIKDKFIILIDSDSWTACMNQSLDVLSNKQLKNASMYTDKLTALGGEEALYPDIVMRTELDPNDEKVRKYYASENNEYDFGNHYLDNPSLGNCTWYAFGRMLELSDESLHEQLHAIAKMGRGPGVGWMKEELFGQLFHTSLEEEYKNLGPIPGAIVVYENHVEAVEEVYYDEKTGMATQILTSRSGYGGANGPHEHFLVKKYELEPDGITVSQASRKHEFLGYIYVTLPIE